MVTQQNILTRGSADDGVSPQWYHRDITGTVSNIANQIVGLDMYAVDWDTFEIVQVREDQKIQAILAWFSKGIQSIAEALWIQGIKCNADIKKFWPKQAIIGCEISKDGVVDKTASDALRVVIRKKGEKYFWPHLAENAFDLSPEVFVKGYLELEVFRNEIVKSLSHLRPH